MNLRISLGSQNVPRRTNGFFMRLFSLLLLRTRSKRGAEYFREMVEVWQAFIQYWISFHGCFGECMVWVQMWELEALEKEMVRAKVPNQVEFRALKCPLDDLRDSGSVKSRQKWERKIMNFGPRRVSRFLGEFLCEDGRDSFARIFRRRRRRGSKIHDSRCTEASANRHFRTLQHFYPSYVCSDRFKPSPDNARWKKGYSKLVFIRLPFTNPTLER